LSERLATGIDAECAYGEFRHNIKRLTKWKEVYLAKRVAGFTDRNVVQTPNTWFREK
jgi:hypothetical protein